MEGNWYSVMDENIGYGENDVIISYNHEDSRYEELGQNSLVNGAASEAGVHPQISCSHLSLPPGCYRPGLINEAASAAVLSIRCKDSYAELHKDKFGSGCKGKCILFEDRWVTPSDFESIAGINSRSWKRSIRFNGICLQTIIDKGFLIPHEGRCVCYICEDHPSDSNSDASYVPPRRKKPRIHYSRSVSVQTNSKELNSTTSIPISATLTQSSSATPAPVSTISDACNPVAEALMRIKQTSRLESLDDWKEVEDALEDILTTANSVKALIQKLKEGASLGPQLDFVLAESAPDCPEELRDLTATNQPEQFPAQEYSAQVLRQESYEEVPAESCSYQAEYPAYNCAYCGQDGYLQCTGCHIVHYCCIGCQQQDWSSHQISCKGQLLGQ